MQNNPIQVIGLGPAADRLATQELDIVRKAEVLAGGEELLRAFRDSEAEFLPLRTPLNQWIGEIVSRREQGRRVTVLADGDPLFYGIGSRLCCELGPDAVRTILRIGVHPYPFAPG